MRHLALFILLATANVMVAQCETWNDSPQKSTAEDAHSIYRQAIKSKNFEDINSDDFKIAEENWQKAYDIAPAADGKRDFHMMDGAKIYTVKFNNETDEAKKAEYAQKIKELYDQAIGCYESGTLTPKCTSGDSEKCLNEKISFLKGRLGYDMYYYHRTPYVTNYDYLIDALNKGGNNSEYIILDPLAKITVHQFQEGAIDKATALDNLEKMRAIAEYNIKNNATYGQYYDQAWAAAQGHYSAAENELFDCEYFKEKYKPEYEENKNDMEKVKTIAVLLKRKGCDDSDPFVKELSDKWEAHAQATNAARKAEFEANNPAILAKKAYDAGDYAGAVTKYTDAINAETDPNKKATMLFSKASIQFRKLKKYSAARATALEAAKARSGFGKPYMLIGDMYATSARNCGDSWNQRLAVIAAIDKYNYAASLDPSIADEARSKAAKYRSSLPAQEEGFMRKVKAGQTVKVGCWIGESVKVRFQ